MTTSTKFVIILRNKYIGKKTNAFGIDKILYKCPDCKTEFALETEEDIIVCKHCGLKVKVNEYYDLERVQCNNIPKDIDEWFKWQRRCVRKEILNDDFKLSFAGSICTIKLDKLRKEEKSKQVLSIGNVTLNNKGLFFKGSLNGEKVDFAFNANSIYSLTLSTKGYLEFYSDNEYYMIYPKEKNKELIKWTLASEEIHNRYDEKWDLACSDVFDYNKGDIYDTI